MSSFSDNLKKALTGATRFAVKKSGEVIETAKNKYSEFDLNGEIDELYKNLGKTVYVAFCEDKDVSDEIKTICNEIGEKTAELNVLKKK